MKEEHKRAIRLRNDLVSVMDDIQFVYYCIKHPAINEIVQQATNELDPDAPCYVSQWSRQVLIYTNTMMLINSIKAHLLT
jgi:hypothetical protein